MREDLGAAERQVIDLSLDEIARILFFLPLAHDIALAGMSCRSLRDAARLALKARPFSSEVVTLTGHTSAVWSVAAVPDGRIITGSYDTVRVWREGACERTIGGGRVVAALPGGARFVSASHDRTAKLWTFDGGLACTFAVGNYVHSVAALPDGVHFVVGLSNGYGLPAEVRLYHVDGTRVHTFTGHTNLVKAVAVTPDGQHIISGSNDKLVKVWSVSSKSLVSTCIGHFSWSHSHFVHAVAAMPDGKRILSGSVDSTVRVWRLNGTLELDPERTFGPAFGAVSELHTGAVNALVALPDNQHALAASVATVKLFNVNDGALLRTFRHHAENVYCLALLPDGLRFVSGSYDNTARIAYHGLAPQ